MNPTCSECGPKGCKGACPLPLIVGESIYVPPKPARAERQPQPHVDRIDNLGSPFLPGTDMSI